MDLLFENEYIRIYSQSGDVFIEAFKKGFSLDQLSTVFAAHPEIGISSYTTLRNVIITAPRGPEKFGELKQRIDLDITNDEMRAYITFNMPKEDLEYKNRQNLKQQVSEMLNNAGIKYGIKNEVLSGDLVGGKQYLIAEGLPAVNGRDCVIHMYELEDCKPEVKDNGRADFYELKLINRVKVGDWLGERIDASKGIDGISVKGNVIKAVPGKTTALEYDKNTVQEVAEEGKTVLYSRVDGAVNYTSGKISVSNYLEIDGDVGIGTGNIKFDGYVTIKGTVVDGFSVQATRDIEINGPLGVGNVKEIISTGGSVYIKGGLASRGKSIISALKNVYTKFLENATINCDGSVHIGYYCINSHISAKEIVFDSANGQIIGGHMTAEISVRAPVVGSDLERKTIIEVKGFNRNILIEQFESMLKRLNILKMEQQKLKLQISMLKESQMDPYQRKQYTDLLERMQAVKDEIKSIEDDRKNTAGYLRARGDGEIVITKKIFPNCTLIIKNNIFEINKSSLATTYYLYGNEIKQS